MAQPFTVTFTAGPSDDWRIERLTAVAGESLAAAMHLSSANKTADAAKSSWQLRVVVSYTRYTKWRCVEREVDSKLRHVVL